MTFIMFFIQTLQVNAEPSKVMSLNFDDSASIVYINIDEPADATRRELKF